LRAAGRDFPSAYAFRRFLQKTLPDHLLETPAEDPLAKLPRRAPAAIPEDIARRWPSASPRLLSGDDPALLANLPIDASVRPVGARGGPVAAEGALRRFVEERLPAYAEARNHPDDDASSGLSPYLHFGHLSAAEAVHAVLAQEDWTPSSLGEDRKGSRTGWWGTGESAEGFLDQLVTWRELGFAFSFHRPGEHDRWESLPEWARRTMEEHAGDPRSHVYTRAQLAGARTHDPVWNAAQRQLLREGRMQNYLRMLWGKKVLKWSPHPREAFDTLIDLNNRYAVDGRDPNSYSGISWVLGRFDRPWGPERPIFGKVRYMTSANTSKKLRLKEFLREYGEGTDPPQGELPI
jgi:deoxyribodipyrimidine photo-lyase